MTDKEIMQMALDALDDGCGKYTDEYRNLIEALRTALAQPEPEPVAWGILNTRPTEKQLLMMVMLDEPEPSHLVVPLYTAPPQHESTCAECDKNQSDGWALYCVDCLREFYKHDPTNKRTWVGLSDEEIKAFDTWHDNREEEVGWCNPSEIVAYIEAKLKEKNT